MIKRFLRSEGNYDVDEASVASGLECKDESLTVQADAKEADINFVMKRVLLTREMPVSRKGSPMFGDFTGVLDYKAAMNAVAEVNGYFSMLPPDLQMRFGNDAGAFVKFCSDEGNRDALVELGIVVKPPEAAAEPRLEPKGPPAPPASPAAPAAPAPAPGASTN